MHTRNHRKKLYFLTQIKSIPLYYIKQYIKNSHNTEILSSTFKKIKFLPIFRAHLEKIISTSKVENAKMKLYIISECKMNKPFLLLYYTIQSLRKLTFYLE